MLPTDAFRVVGYGVDDISIGFDMEGSRMVPVLNAVRGVEQRRGKMLGERGSWGSWCHLFGRSVAHWKEDTKRLYVQAKLATEGELCPPEKVGAAIYSLRERMALVGIVTPDTAWVTRVDVAVDARCRPEAGKLLLDGLEAVRPPNGWRTRAVGTPRSTVYFTARGSEKVLARSYCRNLKTKQGKPFGMIRLEAEQRFGPRECMLERVEAKDFASAIWRSRYGGLAGRISRLGREVQAVEIHDRVKAGELTYQQGERLAMFLDLERLGLAASYYPKSVYAARRREAARLGYSASEAGSEPLEVELAALLAPYMRTVEVAD